MSRDTSELRKQCLDLINAINYLPWVYQPTEEELNALNTANQTIREYLEYLCKPRKVEDIEQYFKGGKGK